MTISRHKREFQSSSLPKPYYMGAIYSSTRDLFDLQAALAETQVSEIIVSQNNVRVRTAIENIELILYPDEVRSLPLDMIALGDQEPTERIVLTAAARTSKMIFDIGANIGWYSMLFARLCPQATIYAFEPVPLTSARLHEHMTLNEITNIRLVQLALGNKEGTLEMHFHSAESGAASSNDNRSFSGTKKELVNLTTLDTYTALHNLSPGLIKCDVEGAELAVIQGGFQTISNEKPILILELLRKWSSNFGYHPNDVINLLEGLGYHCYAIEPDRHLSRCLLISDSTIATNFLFINPERHHSFLSSLSLELKCSE